MNTEHIVSLAKRFAQHRSLKISTVSTYAANDGKWVEGLEAGASCTLRKAKDVLDWFDANWPEDLEWPTAIPRPSVQPKRRAS